VASIAGWEGLLGRLVDECVLVSMKDFLFGSEPAPGMRADAEHLRLFLDRRPRPLGGRRAKPGERRVVGLEVLRGTKFQLISANLRE